VILSQNWPSGQVSSRQARHVPVVSSQWGVLAGHPSEQALVAPPVPPDVVLVSLTVSLWESPAHAPIHSVNEIKAVTISGLPTRVAVRAHRLLVAI
jgi:hypothetical protein